MGGKSHSTNDQMVQFEQQQAADAAAKEVARQARLTQGSQAINDIFSSANFNDQFYNKYNQAQLDYQDPQLSQQYTAAQKKLTYDLARGGTLRSKAAADATGLLAGQNQVAQAAIGAQADQQTAALRQQILNEKQSATNQLYSTEDPTIAANTATGLVQQSAIQSPNLQPLGAMFTPLIVGGANALGQAYQNYSVNQGMQPRPATGTGALVNVT